MRGQSQIIVRREIDDLLAVEGADRRLLVVEHAQLEVRALGLEFVELVGEIGERVGAGCGGHGRPRELLFRGLRGSTRIESLSSKSNDRKLLFAGSGVHRRESAEQEVRGSRAARATRSHLTPFGYTRILLASPVLRRSMALPKSFIEMRSVIAGCRLSLPAFSSAVIWYQV